MNRKKTVIFDLDGTLLDTLNDLTSAVNHTLRNHSFPERSADEIRRFLGNGAKHLIRCALPNSVGEDEFAEIFTEYKEYYNANSHIETRPYDGVPQLLKELKNKGFLIAVVSNKPDTAVRELCCVYFGDLVDMALGDRDDIQRKPSAEPVHYIMKKLDCDSAVFVGDSEVDIATAENAGLPCVSVTWGFRDRDVLEAHGAMALADNADELMKNILNLLGGE